MKWHSANHLVPYKPGRSGAKGLANSFESGLQRHASENLRGVDIKKQFQPRPYTGHGPKHLLSERPWSGRVVEANGGAPANQLDRSAGFAEQRCQVQSRCTCAHHGNIASVEIFKGTMRRTVTD